MNLHANAGTCPHSRRLLAGLCRRLDVGGGGRGRRCECAFGAKWVRRYREGEQGLLDRSSAPRRGPRSTEPSGSRRSLRCDGCG